VAPLAAAVLLFSTPLHYSSVTVMSATPAHLFTLHCDFHHSGLFSEFAILMFA
jgi:hypothetical protein